MTRKTFLEPHRIKMTPKTSTEHKGNICCKGCYKLGFQEGKAIRDKEDIPNQRNKDTTLKANKMEWMSIGWNEIQFKIPKEYNHQLIKEFEIIKDKEVQEGKAQTILDLEEWLNICSYKRFAHQDYWDLEKGIREKLKQLLSSIDGLGGEKEVKK